MLCCFHSWNELESFRITVTKQYLTSQRRGEDGVEVVSWLARIAGTSRLNDAVGWDEIWHSFPAWVKQASDLSWMILNKILCCFRTKVLWRQRIELLRQTKFFCSQRSGDAERREVKSWCCICRRRWRSEVAALSEQAPWQHGHVHSSELLNLGIRHTGGVVERGRNLCAQKKGETKLCGSEMRGKGA